MKKTQGTKVVALLASAVCAVGLLAGCSDSSDKASGQASASATVKADEYLLKIAQCMRDKGVDVPDPDSTGSISIPDGSESVARECEKTVGLPGGDGGNDLAQPGVQEELVKAAQCLRKEGYDVPDPSAGQGIQLNGNIPQATMQKCFSSLNGGK